MIYKDIVTKRTYTQNGQEKTIWLNVGTLRTSDDGKEFIELNMYPNTPFYVFEKKAKEEKLVDADTGETIPPEALKPTLTEEQKKNMTVDEVADLSSIPF